MSFSRSCKTSLGKKAQDLESEDLDLGCVSLLNICVAQKSGVKLLVKTNWEVNMYKTTFVTFLPKPVFSVVFPILVRGNFIHPFVLPETLVSSHPLVKTLANSVELYLQYISRIQLFILSSELLCDVNHPHLDGIPASALVSLLSFLSPLFRFFQNKSQMSLHLHPFCGFPVLLRIQLTL